MKAAEDGNGLILRLMETNGVDTPVMITLPFVDIVVVHLTSLVEENERLLPIDRNAVRAIVKAFNVVTIGIGSKQSWPPYRAGHLSPPYSKT